MATDPRLTDSEADTLSDPEVSTRLVAALARSARLLDSISDNAHEGLRARYIAEILVEDAELLHRLAQ